MEGCLIGIFVGFVLRKVRKVRWVYLSLKKKSDMVTGIFIHSWILQTDISLRSIHDFSENSIFTILMMRFCCKQVLLPKNARKKLLNIYKSENLWISWF